MKTAVFKEHEKCIRKLIIVINFSECTLRFILRHITENDPSQYHDVDEYIALSYNEHRVVYWLVCEGIRLSRYGKLMGYPNVEIHLEKGGISNRHLEHAKSALYKRGWHSIDEAGLYFVNCCESEEEKEDGNKTH